MLKRTTEGGFEAGDPAPTVPDYDDLPPTQPSGWTYGALLARERAEDRLTPVLQPNRFASHERLRACSTASADPKPLTELVTEALAATFEALERLPDSPCTRELRVRARAYEQTTNRWTAVPPSVAQVEAVLELIEALRAEVTGADLGDALRRSDRLTA
jgi:hypothetical protein